MYLDVDLDGLSTPKDALSSSGENHVDVWIETNRNRDGSELDYSRLNGSEATINSYEFILRAVGGEVEWGNYVNNQSTMTVPFGPLHSATDYYNGFGGATALSPGRYRLGSLTVSVKSGTPRLTFASRTPLWAVARTSFGSRLKGKDGDHTIKFTENSTDLGVASEDIPGDWLDATGLTPRKSEAALPDVLDRKALVTSVLPHRTEGSPSIRVRTVSSGLLKVEIFDLSGRLARTLMNRVVPSGTYEISVPSDGIACGVYFYRVRSGSELNTGKFLVLR